MKDELNVELMYVLKALREGRVEELLECFDHPASEGVVEVALEALTSPHGSVESAIAAAIQFAA